MMNEYIIDPTIVYFWNTSEGLCTFFLLFLIISAIVTVISSIIYIISVTEDDFPDGITPKQLNHWVIGCWVITIFFALGVIFIPNKTTLVEMTMAKLATRDNLQWTTEQVKELADYVAGLLK